MKLNCKVIGKSREALSKKRATSKERRRRGRK